MNPGPGEVYAGRISDIDVRLGRRKKADRAFIIIKIALLVGGLALVSRFYPERLWTSVFAGAVAAILFAAAAAGHGRVLGKIRALRTMRRVNEDELAALDGRFLSGTDSGLEFVDSSHQYALDLDLFGDRSVFHLLNRTTTRPGRKALADLLGRYPDDGLAGVTSRQEAVGELRDKADFRQALRAHGLAMDDAASEQRALGILARTPKLPCAHPAFRTALVLFPILALGAFGGMFAGLPWTFFAGVVLAETILNRTKGGAIAGLYREASGLARVLKAYARIIGEVEGESFAAERLRRLREALRTNDGTASRAIRRLVTILEWMDARSSPPLHALLNNTLLWDLHCACRIDRWRRRTAGSAEAWFRSVGEIEALASLANFAFNHPSFAVPLFKADGFFLKAEALGHPLIPESERVVNDFAMDAGARLVIVTGPNMAGKSTFLRTVGVNAVLAFAGAPVCAARLDISLFRLVTSMKTADSLDQHLSLFYAELVRLKTVMEASRSGRPVFFMIDEMLKGTNALDRHKGAVALIRQLHRAGAPGIVATHDLELTGLAGELPGVRNVHFDSAVVGSEVRFDFKLKPGVCESFNALLLMKQMGIDV